MVNSITAKEKSVCKKYFAVTLASLVLTTGFFLFAVLVDYHTFRGYGISEAKCHVLELISGVAGKCLLLGIILRAVFLLSNSGWGKHNWQQKTLLLVPLFAIFFIYLVLPPLLRGFFPDEMVCMGLPLSSGTINKP